MSSATIQRAIALGISADTTDAQRALRQVQGILRQVKEPAEALRAQMHFLGESFKAGEISSQQFSDSLGRAGQNADKQTAKLAKLREETSAWGAGMRQLGMSQFAQDLKRSKAGADAFSAGMATMKRTTDEVAAAVRASQASLTGWGHIIHPTAAAPFETG